MSTKDFPYPESGRTPIEFTALPPLLIFTLPLESWSRRTQRDAQRFLEFNWVPDLAFLRDARLALPFEEAIRLNDFLRNNGALRLQVPIKERSLEMFGDEKRHDILAAGALFHEGRLTLNHLRCFPVIEPLGWHRGPNKKVPVIALENAATWESYRRWNMEAGHFSAVVYGQGNCFAERVPFLAEIFRELGGSRPVFYFGDLDAAGLRIPARASRKAQREGLPRVEPHEQSYRWLLDQAQRAKPANESDPARRADFDWLGGLAEEAWTILGSQQRLAQECVGLERLLNLDPH